MRFLGFGSVLLDSFVFVLIVCLFVGLTFSR